LRARTPRVCRLPVSSVFSDVFLPNCLPVEEFKRPSTAAAALLFFWMVGEESKGQTGKEWKEREGKGGKEGKRMPGADICTFMYSRELSCCDVGCVLGPPFVRTDKEKRGADCTLEDWLLLQLT